MADQTLPVRVKHTLSLEIGDNAFWIIVWTLLSAALLGLVLIATNRATESDRLIVNAADPVAAACATGLSSTVSNQCLVLMNRPRSFD